MTYTLSSPSLTDPSHPSSIGTLMVLSRWSDPHWRALFQPNTTSQSAIDATAARLPYNLVSRRGATRHQVAIESETGEVVGYARWVLPGSLSSLSAGLGENGDVNGGGVVWPEAQTAEVDEATMNLFREKRKEGLDEHGRLLGLRHDLQEARSRPLEVMDEVIRKREGGMLDLDYLSTHPLHQHRGIGTQLLLAGLAIADRYKLKTFVTSSPAGLKLYLKHGFKLVETVEREYGEFMVSQEFREEEGGDKKEGGKWVAVDYFLIREPKGADGSGR